MALAGSLLAMPAVAASDSSLVAFTQAGPVTPQQAAPFIGDWTLALQGRTAREVRGVVEGGEGKWSGRFRVISCRSCR